MLCQTRLIPRSPDGDKNKRLFHCAFSNVMLVIVSFFLVVVLVRRVFDWQWPSDRGTSNYSSSHMEQHSRTTFKLIFTMFLSPSGDLGIGLVWHNLSPPHHPTHFLVPLLKSSSNWTKFSMRGPQLFSGWYQMILGVFRCSQLFFDVLSCLVMFSAGL